MHVRGVFGNPPGHPGAGPLTRNEPALRDQLPVSVGDGVAGEPEVGRQLPGGRQPEPLGQPATPDGLTQSSFERPADAGAPDVQVQVHTGSGPCSWHASGPYPWARTSSS